MKEIVVYDVPKGATIMVAHDIEDTSIRIPQTHIIDIYHHDGGELYLQYNDYRRLLIRIRHFMCRQIELRTSEIPPNHVSYNRMMIDLI